MCGIAGILFADKGEQGIATLIQAMLARLRHRGPDDEGIYLSPQKEMAFAHTRLSILDLSSSGHQPMSTEDGRYWITFNGEIYNYKELQVSLQAAGEKFQSQTDTEVILKLYRRMGERCLEQLRGMFAFAIWDNVEKKCFLARDPLGIKPLYFLRSKSTLVFASELRAILATKLSGLSLSPEGLYGYLLSGSVPEPYTIIRDVSCLEAGHCMCWEKGKVTKRQYWNLSFPNETISEAKALEKTRNALLDSVKHHFVSDVPVGIFLSGGIDSAALLALAKRLGREKVDTYTIAFEEAHFNEGSVAKKIAAYFDSTHHEFRMTNTLARELLSQFLRSLDQPTIDGFNTFCVSFFARSNHAKVVLSGVGGDEMFGGYSSFRNVPRMVRWSKRWVFLRHLCVGQGMEFFRRSPRLSRLGDFFQREPSVFNAFQAYRGIFSHKEAGLIAGRYLFADSFFAATNESVFPSFTSLEDEVCFWETTCYMRNQLLRDSDVMSMRHGLELRTPFVDRNLSQTVSSIPYPIRLQAHKKLLIKAIPELPSWLIQLPKRGFVFPIQEWIKKDWGDMSKDIAVQDKALTSTWYRQWSLFILQKWLSEYLK